VKNKLQLLVLLEIFHDCFPQYGMLNKITLGCSRVLNFSVAAAPANIPIKLLCLDLLANQGLTK
jgi:hypothetical protein